ncbi:MAG: sulfite exporter TauE/SafE family protein [Methylovulum sp.]|nr:sulfite exporter TauE/SafE family protein [Methylovulum sp.]
MLDPIHMSLVLGLFIGLVLAITGAGGAILSLPLLVFFLNLKMVDAAPISLMAITLSAGLAAALGLRAGIVRYKAATLLASFGVLFAPLGVLLAHQLPERVLVVLFSVVLLIVAIRSFQKFRTPTLLIGDDCEDPNGCDDDEKPEPACSVNPATSKLFWNAPCTKRLILTGSFSGFISGLLGVGGGFIIVPTLHSISNLESKMIVATSLAVISLVSLVSALSYAGNGNILWPIALPFVGATLVGMLLGRMLHSKISSHISVLIFGLLSVTIAVLMLAKTWLSF